MADDLGSAVIPSTVEWTLQHKRTKEIRTYEQTELAIEGEARLVGLAQQVGARLSETDFPWDMLVDLFSDETKPLDWDKAIVALGSVADVAPNAVADSSLILFGVYLTRDDGTRNPDYEDQRTFLKGAVTFTQWTEILRTFAAQNDYQRLVGSFGRAMAAGATLANPRRPEEIPSEA